MNRLIMIFILVCSLIFFTAGKKLDPELEEVLALGYSYSEASGGDNYFCYKDILILGNTIYHKENGSYIKTDETLYEMLGVGNFLRDADYRQYKNLIVTRTVDDKAFFLYDMDTKRAFNYTSQISNENLYIIDWYLYDGYIYYCDASGDDIRRISLADGEEQIVYSGKKVGMVIREFAMRGDGKILCEWWDGSKREYYLIELYDNGEWKEEKIWETDIKRWRYVEWHAFNQYGLIQVAEFYSCPEGSMSMGEHVIIKENGTIETFDMELKNPCHIYLDEGCLLSDIPYSKKQLSEDRTKLLSRQVLSVTYYDYEGNALETYQLAGFRKIWEGYYMRKLLYQDGKITAIYTQKDTGELYIVQVDAKEVR